jgi:ADP-ribose pyrophosphatase YjhB (NUDIX family)
MNLNIKTSMPAMGKYVYYMLIPLLIVYGRLAPKPRVRALMLKENQVYLVKNWLSPQQWTLPGGGVEGQESERKALSREIKEELNFRFDEENWVYIDTLRRTGTVAPYYYSIYAGKIFDRELSPILNPNGEIVAARWFNVADLPKDISNEFSEAYAQFIQKGSGYGES